MDRYLKLARIFFFFAALLFIAKPFLGFAMFSRLHPPAADNIFVKAFTKRKLEYAKENNYDIRYTLKKPANPIQAFLTSVPFFLSLFFFSIVITGKHLSNLQWRTQIGLFSRQRPYLFNSQLLI